MTQTDAKTNSEAQFIVDSVLAFIERLETARAADLSEPDSIPF